MADNEWEWVTLRYLRGGNGGNLYGPTAAGREYLCSSRHRNYKHPHKSTWLKGIKEQQESEFYQDSETGGWHLAGEHWWTSQDCALVVGTAGQRLVFYPQPRNATDPAHGYPVTTYRDINYTVPENIIQLWEQKIDDNPPRVDKRAAKKLRLKQI